MKLSDIVSQLNQLLPTFTSALTTDVAVATMVRSGTKVTVTTQKDHKLAPGELVVITGADTPIVISSYTRVNTIGTIVTSADHDLTEGTSPTVEILDTGAADAAFIGVKTVCRILNRRTIEVQLADSGATSTADVSLAASRSALQDWNAAYNVDAVPTPSSFEVTTALTIPDPVAATGQTITAHGAPRISGVVNEARLLEAYTKQEPGEVWLIATLGNVTAIKSGKTRGDVVTAENVPGSQFRQRVLQPFMLHALFPAKTEIAGRQVRDDAEALFRPICQSILGAQFDTGLFAAKRGIVNFVEHGEARYDGATYQHFYAFELIGDLQDEDTVGPALDVAFRDIDLTIAPSGTVKAGFMQTVFSLDEETL